MDLENKLFYVVRLKEYQGGLTKVEITTNPVFEKHQIMYVSPSFENASKFLEFGKFNAYLLGDSATLNRGGGGIKTVAKAKLIKAFLLV